MLLARRDCDLGNACEADTHCIACCVVSMEARQWEKFGLTPGELDWLQAGVMISRRCPLSICMLVDVCARV